MKIRVYARKAKFVAKIQGVGSEFWSSNSEHEALGRAVMALYTISSGMISLLEIEFVPKSKEQLAYEERRREATAAHGND